MHLLISRQLLQTIIFIMCLDRLNSNDGGVGVMLRKGFEVTENWWIDVESFEYIDLSVSACNKPSFRLIVLYRPPTGKNSKNKM